MKTAADLIKQLTNVKHLVLIHQNELSKEMMTGLKYLYSAIGVNKFVNHLYLRYTGCKITDSEMKYLTNLLKNNNTITFFGISCESMEHKGVRYLNNVLRDNKTINVFVLNVKRMIGQEIKWLSDILQVNKTIETIELGSWCDIYGFKYL
jgi:hypothetical protein